MAVTVDILAVGPHPDDVELLCGGTVALQARRGARVAILDLARGEMASRGTVADREREAAAAAAVLGVVHRENAGLPDAGIQNTPDARRHVAAILRRLRPQVVIAPAPQGRHPDHRIGAELVRDACFLAGLARLDAATPPHRPRKLVHAITYREDPAAPSFIVDITETFEAKLAAIACFHSQFHGLVQAGEVYPNGEPLADIVRHQAAHYGSRIRRRFGEPFWTSETMRVDDLLALDVATF